MVTLQFLKDAGSLPGVYEEVDFSRGTITSVRAADTADGGLAEGRFAVVVPDAVWAATVRKIPVTQAKTVYSCNKAGVIGCWKPKDATFYEMRFSDGRLQTTNLLKLADKMVSGKQEEENMASVDELAKELEGFEEQAKEGGAKPIEAFGDEGAKAKEGKKVDEKLVAIRSKMGDNAIVNRDGYILQNRKLGRALGFITKSDPVVKVSVKKVAKLDPQGKKIPLPSLSEERLKSFNSGGKLKMSEVETERVLTFVHAKPSKPVAMIIATPKSSDISLTKINSASGALDLKESGDTSMQIHIISMEAAYSYLAFNYGGEIYESDKILGAKATKLIQSIRPTKLKEDAAGKQNIGVVSTITLEKKENRKTLLTEGNYFPLKTYATISTQDLSPENAAILNLNIEASMNNQSISDLSEASQKSITMLPDNSGYESVWFNKGQAINVTRFDDANVPVTDVRVPVREKSLNKDGTKYRYKFVYNKLDDPENGPLANKGYQRIIELTGMSVDEFTKQVEGFTRTSRAKGAGKDFLTADEYLRAKMSRNLQVDGVKSFLELQKELENIA